MLIKGYLQDAAARIAAWERRSPLLFAWLIAFAVLVIAQRELAHVPMYHDAMLHWRAAHLFAERIWFPFIENADAGHPPLVSWMLAILWYLPADRIVLMHVLSSGAAALLGASVYAATRHTLGRGAGIIAAMLVLFNPVTVAQAAQLNLDLYMAAFVWLAVAGAALGKARLVMIGLTLTVMTKLNGAFVLVPFGLWMAGVVIARRKEITPRFLLDAAVPFLVPIAVFAIYHAIKYQAVGHLFDSGEFEGGRQTALVATWDDFVLRYEHSWRGATKWNGNALAMEFLKWLAILAGVAAIFQSCVREKLRSYLSTPEREGDGAWQPMSVAQLVAFAWLLASTQLLMQSLRDVWTLVRYFIVCYPAMAISVVALAGLIGGRWRHAFVIAVTAPLLFGFMLRWHPANPERLTRWVRKNLLEKPPSAENYENTLQFADVYEMLRDAVKRIKKLGIERPWIEAIWPFHTVLSDPAHGIVEQTLDTTASIDGAAIGKTAPDVILKFSTEAPREEPEIVIPPPGYRVEKIFRKRGAWIVMLVRE